MADNISGNSVFDEIFKYINVIAWNRWTLGLCFNDIAISIANMERYGAEMQEISNLWNNVKLSLIKCGIKKG